MDESWQSNVNHGQPWSLANSSHFDCQASEQNDGYSAVFQRNEIHVPFIPSKFSVPQEKKKLSNGLSK